MALKPNQRNIVLCIIITTALFIVYRNNFSPVSSDAKLRQKYSKPKQYLFAKELLTQRPLQQKNHFNMSPPQPSSITSTMTTRTTQKTPSETPSSATEANATPATSRLRYHSSNPSENATVNKIMMRNTNSVRNTNSTKVAAQCLNYFGTPDASPVSLVLYLEVLCPDCKDFIKQQLYPTWRLFKSTGILNMTLVPYGNAEETKVGDTYKFTCQHGEEECYGNLIETCAIHMTNSTDVVFPFINCLEATEQTPRSAVKKCASANDIDYTTLMACVAGPLGNQLEHIMAQKTNALQPAHQYVPWVTINGVHTEAIQQAAQKNLKKLLCSTYKGTPPHECEKMQISGCARK